MKKMMAFSAVALCAAVSFGDVSSQNIVGYAGIETEENSAPIIGSVFFNVGGGETYDLRTLAIPEIRDEEGELLDYADPMSEFLRVLDPNSSLTTAKYCYVSYGYLEDCVEDPDASKWAIGWWKYQVGVDYSMLINAGDDTLKIKSAVNINNGMAFLGNFSEGHTVSLVSNGEVATEVTQFETAETSAPLFVNYLPDSIKLSDITIPELRDEEGELLDYADPMSEFLRVLDPNSSLTTAKYCYVSYGYLEDCVDEPDASLWAIGWWKYEVGVDYSVLINAGDDSLKLKTEIDVPAGSGFLGNFSEGHSVGITFPSALDVPSKK